MHYFGRLVELQHRILKVVILQEKSRKMGMSLLPQEETLNSRLEALSATLNSNSFKVFLLPMPMEETTCMIGKSFGLIFLLIKVL